MGVRARRSAQRPPLRSICARVYRRPRSYAVTSDGEVSDEVFYRIELTVTDSQGLSTTVTRDLTPQKAFFTVNTNVAGLTFTVDGQPQAASYLDHGVVGVRRQIAAPAEQMLNGQAYEFVGWSDGGALTHSISTPVNVTTYTALFAPRANGTLSANPNPIIVTDGSGLGITTLSWNSQGTTTVEVRVGSPNGSLFAQSNAGSHSSTTGKWVGNGTKFYLQNRSGGLPLTSANTLAAVTVAPVSSLIGSASTGATSTFRPSASAVTTTVQTIGPSVAGQ